MKKVKLKRALQQQKLLKPSKIQKVQPEVQDDQEKFHCRLGRCGKIYGSYQSLYTHLKIKHNHLKPEKLYSVIVSERKRLKGLKQETEQNPKINQNSNKIQQNFQQIKPKIIKQSKQTPQISQKQKQLPQSKNLKHSLLHKRHLKPTKSTPQPQPQKRVQTESTHQNARSDLKSTVLAKKRIPSSESREHQAPSFQKKTSNNIEQESQQFRKPNKPSKMPKALLQNSIKIINNKKKPGRPPKTPLKTFKNSAYYKQKSQSQQQQNRKPGRPKKCIQEKVHIQKLKIQTQNIQDEQVQQERKNQYIQYQLYNEYLTPSQQLQLKRKMQQNPEQFTVNEERNRQIILANYKRRVLERKIEKCEESQAKRGRKQGPIIIDVINPFSKKKLCLNQQLMLDLKYTIATFFPKQIFNNNNINESSSSKKNSSSSSSSSNNNSNNTTTGEVLFNEIFDINELTLNVNVNENKNNINKKQKNKIEAHQKEIINVMNTINCEFYDLENIKQEYLKIISKEEVNLYRNDSKLAYILTQVGSYTNKEFFAEFCAFVGLINKQINKKKIFLLQQTHGRTMEMVQYINQLFQFTTLQFDTSNNNSNQNQNEQRFQYLHKYDQQLTLLVKILNCVFVQ